MILEAIEDDNGGERGLVAKPWGGQRVKDFKATADSYKALGADARHGSTKNGVELSKVTLFRGTAVDTQSVERLDC